MKDTVVSGSLRATDSLLATNLSVSSSILGTVTSGTWQGTTIGASYLPTATTGAKGIMQVGTGLGVNSGTVSVTYGTAAGAALASSGGAGSANSASRSDHTHPFPALSSCTGTISITDKTTGTLTIARGGTGKTSASEAWTALGGGASGKHADSYFVQAIESTDTIIVRFNGTAGQIEGSRMSIDDNGLIKLTRSNRYPGDIQLYNSSNKKVAEYWYDTGNDTNVTTSACFRWYEGSPNSTANTTTTGKGEYYSLPSPTAGLSADATYDIYTTKLWPYDLSATDDFWYVQQNSVTCAHMELTTLGPANTEGIATIYVGNSTKKETNNNASGRIYLYGPGNAGSVIRASTTATNTTYTHYLPNSTGWVVTGGNGTSTGVGGADQIVYLGTDGVLTAGTSATNENTASTIVKRDASGNFSAGTITATLSGNATNVTGTVAIAHGGTGKTTDIEAITNLGGPYILCTGTVADTTKSIDTDYKVAGTYYCAASSLTNALLGTKPSYNAGFKWITIGGYRAATLYQIAGNNSARLYYRNTQNGTTNPPTWTDWYQFVFLKSNGSETIENVSGKVAKFEAVGNSMKPVYVTASGVITACEDYAGAVPIVWRTSLTKGSNPSSDIWNGGHGLFVTGTGTNEVDRLAFLESQITTAGRHNYFIRAYGFKASSTTNAYLRFGVDNSNYVELYTNAPFISGNQIIAYAGTSFVSSTTKNPYAYIQFNTRSGTSGIGSGTVTYTTSDTAMWAQICCQIPTRKNTYATAGDTNSTVTYSYTSYPTEFFFREYSYNSSNAARINKYEDFYLPAVTKDRTDSTYYNIYTTKLWPYNRTTTGSYWYVQQDGLTCANLDLSTVGSAGTEGFASLVLGNTTQKATAKNATGRISLYNSNGSNVTIQGGYGTFVNNSNINYINTSNILVSGHIEARLGGEVIIEAHNSATGGSVLLDSGSGTNHGVYSRGYTPTTTSFTSSGKWMIYRDSTGTVYLNGTAAACSGNAATATRINGNLGALAATTTTTHNIWVSSTASADGIPKYISGVYIQPSTKTITADTFNGNATSATTSKATFTASLSANSSDNTHKGALQQYFNANKSTITRNSILGYYSAAYGNGSMYMGYFLSGYDSNPYGGFFVAHYNTAYYVGIQNGSYSQRQIWTKGDAVTGAVWNDYAEYRKCDELPPGACVQEQDDGHLIASNKRLIPGASIISDTWGFSQGETEEAKTPIAISGRVLAYTFLPRHMYHAGQAVCSAPGGTIDIMTREEIKDYPDAIIGIVSEIPEYEEWGGGENADRPPVKVNGRIWIKVR